MLEDIDWEKPAKLIVDKELDLCSKTSRESGFLKTISEQITLILFAHYNAILRRYRTILMRREIGGDYFNLIIDTVQVMLIFTYYFTCIVNFLIVIGRRKIKTGWLQTFVK